MLYKRRAFSFHSISFPSEWGVCWISVDRHNQNCFHSISFPSEWGAEERPRERSEVLGLVSIQLVSPASGEKSTKDT